MKKTFEYVVEHGENWLDGLIELNAPDEFTPGLGLLVAHDCLEHFKGDDGSCDKEFMAFGAMLWIRGFSGELQYSSFGYKEVMAMDLSGEVWDYYVSGSKLSVPNKKIFPIEEIINVANCTKEKIESNAFEHWGDCHKDKDFVNKFILSLTYWMTIGYRKAKIKYPDQWSAAAMFKEIQAKIDTMKNNFEVGDLVEVSWIYSLCQIEIKHILAFNRKDFYL